MGGNDSPALGTAYPGLHLPPHPPRRTLAIEQCGRHRGIAAEGGDDRLVGPPVQPDRRARGAERRDRIVAVEILADAIAQRAPVVAEDATRTIILNIFKALNRVCLALTHRTHAYRFRAT